MKFLNRPRAGNSPRSGRKHIKYQGTNWRSSQTLNIPNSPLAARRSENSDQNNLENPNSAQNSPKSKLKTRPRPRSLSDDRINNEELGETVALLTNLKSLTVTSGGQEGNHTEIEMEEQTSAIV